MGVTPRERRRSVARFLDEERMEVRERELMSLSDASSHLGRCVLRPHPVGRARIDGNLSSSSLIQARERRWRDAQTGSSSALTVRRRRRRRGLSHVRGHNQKWMGERRGEEGEQKCGPHSSLGRWSCVSGRLLPQSSCPPSISRGERFPTLQQNIMYINLTVNLACSFYSM
uniref:Uncharacterized protein n=1 Tax=Oryza sativa subsp. japonica TaxID=39947 RepID=Q2R4X2_ORYSJ|nr:hypothetical protein LOC_Os11g27000 [Oryza sativa Japonica Group]